MINFVNNIIFSNLEADYALPGQLGFQYPANTIARGIIDLHNHIMFFLVFIVVFTFAMIYFTLSTFTINNNSNLEIFNKVKNFYNVRISHNTLLETLWIIIPSLILISIAIPSFALLYAMEISGVSLLTMKVTGHQWYWSYSFVFSLDNPQIVYDIASNTNIELGGSFSNNIAEFSFDSYMVPTNELSDKGLRLLETTNPVVLPVDTFIKVYVTASDVLHCWAVPSLGIKIDACPGRLNQVNLFIDRIGHFYGQCSELCGVNHGFMPIEIYSITKLDYITYLCLACEDFRNNSFNQLINYYHYFYEDGSNAIVFTRGFYDWWQDQLNLSIKEFLNKENSI